MKKPIIYYQFDNNIYYDRHYKKGYFEYERDGFGEITNESNIIEKILEYIDNPKMPKKYEKGLIIFLECMIKIIVNEFMK